MPKSEVIRLHAVVKGRVQGVGFRAFTQWNASALDLTGWTRNRWDGTVEVLAEGSQENLNSFLSALKRGPRVGTTQNVVYDWLEATGEFSSFRIRMTG